MAVAGREILARPQERSYSEDEYFALEEAADEKHEYVHGRMRLMSDGTDDHAVVSVNVAAELRAALRGRGCAVMSSDMKVRAAGEIYYPDATVVCGTRQFFGGNRTVITNPVLVAEVLSPSTESKDKGEKFRNYLTVESLTTYLLVSQDEPRVELFSRSEGGDWQYTVAEGLGGVLLMPSLSIKLILADVYDQVDFAEEPGDE